jgi:hypothetical protein
MLRKGLSLLEPLPGHKKSRECPISGHSLCPGNGARSALRSLLSVALSSGRALQFYHHGWFLPLDGFSL